MSDYMMYKAARFISRALPLPYSYALGRRISDFCYLFDHKGRRCVISNIRHILEHQGKKPDNAELARMARENFRNFGRYIVDFFHYDRMTPNSVERLAEIENPEALRLAHKAGRGVLLASAHLGNWELGGAILHALGYPITAVAYPQRTRKTHELFQAQRRRRGVNILTFGEAARGVLRAVKRGDLIGVLSDRDYTLNHEPVLFFGAPARLPSSPARISMRTGAPILPTFLIRREAGRFLLRFYDPLFPEEFKSQNDLRLRLTAILESEVSRNPSQWYIFDDFWGWGQANG